MAKLQPPSSGLHRSLSDSSKKANGQGQCSPRSQSRDRGMAEAADVNLQQDSSLFSKKVTERAENRVSVNVTRRHLPPVSSLNSEQSSGGRLPNFTAGDTQASRSSALLPLGSDSEKKKLPVDLPVHMSAFTDTAVSSNAVERSTSGNKCALDRTGELIAGVVDGAGKNGLDRSKASNKTALDLLADNRSGSQRTSNTSRSVVDSFSNPARSLVDSSNKVSRSAIDVVSNDRKLEDNSHSVARSGGEHSSKPNRSVADSVNKSTRSVADSANKSIKNVVDSANICKSN
ncbi:hypothetical protein C0Q70_11387 [Pomacea canaliculata]|uniref:Uncharacterized protein n=1 Tax=Pomacea canaliculata TaxID=400727 RepID=A0A2T7P5T1_POMCA|nr:hypothetical protein C0Q70_11387 [Pomacea canaliculata]